MPISQVIAPRSGDGWLEKIANGLLRLIKWQVVGPVPEVPRFVTIVAPHTSNWELPLGLICGFASGFLRRWPYGFMMKDVVFRWPLGGLMRAIGGIPIDRSRPHEIVQQMADHIRSRDRFLLAITPEGTRKRTEYWKSGFYHIAQAAEVPILPIAFDYAHRECRVGEIFHPSGDPEADLTVLRAFFGGVTAKRPDKVGPIRFREPLPEARDQ